MIALDRTIAVLLCAGQSRRFGDADKLLHPLAGKPLLCHAADLLAALPVAARIATVRQQAPLVSALLSAKGFMLETPPLGATQAVSLDCGLKAAMAHQPAAILLVLGDMPWVTSAHITALAASADAGRPAASMGDGWIGPPWIAPSSWVQANQHELKPALARDALLVSADHQILRDIDRRADL